MDGSIDKLSSRYGLRFGSLSRCFFRLAWVTVFFAAAMMSPAGASAAPFKTVSADATLQPGWITHRVIPGEMLKEISQRYDVSVNDIVLWNKLDKNKVLLRAGQDLKIKANVIPAKREKIAYVARPGDSWAKIAKRHRVNPKRLRLWNPGMPDNLKIGQPVIIWTEVESEPARPAEKTPREKPFPPVPVEGSGISVGSPSRGRLINGVQLPQNPNLYKVRNPDHSWGSSHMIRTLQEAVSAFRSRSGFKRDLLICDLSRKNGGRFRPHDSHRSGRDVDIQFPLYSGVKTGVIPWQASQVDWDVAWDLVEALIDTGEVQYIFLSRTRQPFLYQAAQRAGADAAYIDMAIQYPRSRKVGIVRHGSGHVKHIHVRFKCGKSETTCTD